MPNFDLNVAFTNEQLKAIHATGTNVIIAKPSSGGSTPDVAWQVFRPLQANTVNWEEKYGIYASTTQIVNGAKLDQLSSIPVPAAEDKLYTLQPSGIISGPASGGSPNSYSLRNNYGTNPPYMTVGLFQDASVNGTSIIGNAISAAGVLNQATATMTPFTTIYIWLQSNVVSNSVVTTVTSPMTQITFGGTVTTRSVKYDSDTGTFINAGPSKELDFISVIHPLL